jgi:voltage-gated potassium channel
VLVGTTLELLAERTREAYRFTRWRKTLQNHTIICGYGTKGRAAIHELQARGLELGELVVIDDRPEARERAVGAGLAAVAGDAASTEVLRQAGSSRPVGRRRHPTATTPPSSSRSPPASSTRGRHRRRRAEEENAHLLRQGGATTSSRRRAPPAGSWPWRSAARRWPPCSRTSSWRGGLDLIEHHVERDGLSFADVAGTAPVIAVVRAA